MFQKKNRIKQYVRKWKNTELIPIQKNVLLCLMQHFSLPYLLGIDRQKNVTNKLSLEKNYQIMNANNSVGLCCTLGHLPMYRVISLLSGPQCAVFHDTSSLHDCCISDVSRRLCSHAGRNMPSEITTLLVLFSQCGFHYVVSISNQSGVILMLIHSP